MSSHPQVRVATAGDADEILRLAFVMWESFDVHAPPGEWEHEFRDVFTTHVDSEQMRAFVVDDPSGSGQLIACGVAWSYRLLPAFWLVGGKMGYLQWFSTAPDWRGQGIASEILQRCVTWLTEKGCTRIQLHTAAKAAELYRRNGFEDSAFANLWLRND